MGPTLLVWLRTYLPTLNTLVTSRLPTARTFSSKAVSIPRRALADQYRTPSLVYFSSSDMGVTTLPLLFDIFLRSGSRTQPETRTCRQGSVPSCRRDLAMV